MYIKSIVKKQGEKMKNFKDFEELKHEMENIESLKALGVEIIPKENITDRIMGWFR